MKQDTLNRFQAAIREFTDLSTIIAVETREVHSSGDLHEAIRHYRDVRDGMDLIKKGKEVLEELKAVLSSDIVPDLMATAKVKTINLTDVGRVTVSGRFSASIIDREDTEHPKQAGHDWLRNNNAGSLVKDTVNSSSLAAFAKDYVENQGRELPDDVFKVGITRTTSITKTK